MNAIRNAQCAVRLAAALACGLGACTKQRTEVVQQGEVERYGLGRPAPTQLIAAWDIDVSPDGAGLPAGHGTPRAGAAIFAAKCAVCHGASGQGQAIYPQLIGGPKGFPFDSDPAIPRTVGNYWPYATSVFDYVRRAMPFTAPGSLAPDEVYAVTAFLLAQNGVIAQSATMDANTLPKVRMPARDRFVPDDRRGGKEVR